VGAVFCAGVRTQPWRLDRNAHSGTNPVGFDRESHLLCAFLVYCYELIQPRSRMPKAAKPASAFKIIDGVRSCHRRAGIFMVSTKQLTTAMKEITAEHIKEHGSESLLPERKDPTGPTLYRQLLRTPEGTNLGAKELHWSSQTFLSLGAMFVLSGNTGFRKAKVALPSGCDFDDRRLRRSSLLGGIDVTLHVDPSPEQLRTLVRGRDKAVIKPPRSKADYDGTTWGAHPIWLVFDDTDAANAARWLLRLELQLPLRGGRRAETPPFVSSAALEPVLHSTADYYLEHLLRENNPEERISAHSFHSFRIGFASALLAASCPYDMIQALARWRSEKIAAIYARLNPSE